MADVLDTPLTFDPIEPAFPAGLDPETAERLHDLAMEGRPFAVPELQKFIKRFPTVPCLKNYLAVCLRVQGKDKQAAKANEMLLEAHPDYLFGRVAVATLRVKQGRLDEALALLGPSLRLRDLQPDTRVFHYSEVKSYYHAAGLCHVAAGDLDACQGIINALEQSQGEVPEVMALQHALDDKRRQRLAERMAKAARLRVQVQEPEIPDTDYPASVPAFQHEEEIDWLYNFGYDLPAASIREILALPRASLVADLQVLLDDAIRVGPACYWNDDAAAEDNAFPSARNALHFLAELKATEVTGTVLDFFSQNSELLVMWLGEGSFTDLLYPHVEPCLARVAAWMKQPGLSWLARGGVSEAVMRLAVREPARRAEVVAWFGELLEFFATSPPADNILDTGLVSSLVWNVCDLRAVELLPQIKTLYDLQRVSEFQVGTYDELARDILEPIKTGSVPPVQPIEQYYREQHPRRNPPEILRGGIESLLDREGAATEPVPVSVGRNDPCPCGSGRKFKKCCM